MARLPSTGRKPALDLSGIESLLSAYFEPSQPSVEALAERFELTEATVRKYLKLALGSLPRGRAACLPREARNVKALINGIPTEDLLGAGRVELLLRRRADGASLTKLAEDFGISRDRVTKLVRSVEPAEGDESEASAEPVVAEASPEPESPEPAVEAEAEVAMAAGPDA